MVSQRNFFLEKDFAFQSGMLEGKLLEFIPCAFDVS